MKAIGLVFLYDRELGAPDEVSKQFNEYFSSVSENLVSENLLGLVELKEILDEKRIYWAGIKENFREIIEDNESIGKLAWKVFYDLSGQEPSDEIKSLVYSGKDTPWNFSLMACVVYK